MTVIVCCVYWVFQEEKYLLFFVFMIFLKENQTVRIENAAVGNDYLNLQTIIIFCKENHEQIDPKT